MGLCFYVDFCFHASYHPYVVCILFSMTFRDFYTLMFRWFLLCNVNIFSYNVTKAFQSSAATIPYQTRNSTDNLASNSPGKSKVVSTPKRFVAYNTFYPPHVYAPDLHNCISNLSPNHTLQLTTLRTSVRESLQLHFKK